MSKTIQPLREVDKNNEQAAEKYIAIRSDGRIFIISAEEEKNAGKHDSAWRLWAEYNGRLPLGAEVVGEEAADFISQMSCTIEALNNLRDIEENT